MCVLCSGPWFITRQILREDGVRGLFRGLVPTFAREMPGYFFFFGGYELCRYVLTPPGKTKDEIGNDLNDIRYCCACDSSCFLQKQNVKNYLIILC